MCVDNDQCQLTKQLCSLRLPAAWLELLEDLLKDSIVDDLEHLSGNLDAVADVLDCFAGSPPPV